MAMRKLLSIHWTGLRLLAALVFALGLWGTVSGLTGVKSELKEALAAVKSGGVGTTGAFPRTVKGQILGLGGVMPGVWRLVRNR